jgi:4-hydroxythreonine-4-phosphate dehydrogenase
MNRKLPRILLTCGEPAGIGPDLCALIAQQDFPCCLAAIGDPGLMAARARLLGLPLALKILAEGETPPAHQAGTLCVAPLACKTEAVPGRLDPANAAHVLDMIRLGAAACLQGRYDALVTPPAHKAVINDAGFSFTGHTEYLAEIVGGYPVMMLATAGLRVALATTHLPLQAVSAAITRPLLHKVIAVLHRDLRQTFGLREPRILVCGLNPHAGEGGYLGREEIETIAPVLDACRSQGMDLRGPLPADTLFLPKYLDTADAVLAMYHDQGLPVLKHKGFGRAVNITLGLPIIRTSVDHGAALDLAGTGQIDASSLVAAVKLAIELSRNSAANPGQSR